MDARRKTLAAMDKWAAHDNVRVAKGLPPEFMANQKQGGGPPPNFSPAKRQIPADHPFDPKALKPMARMLWAMSVSLGHALAAYRQFTRLKSVSVSPDGLVGGRGYVMSVKDVRAKLYDACEALSAISDTIHDEIHANHWKPKLGELEKNDVEDVNKLLGEAEQNLDDPEAEAEDDMEDVEERKGGPKPSERFEAEPKSKLPGEGAAPIDSQGASPASAHREQYRQKQAAYSYDRTGNSSVNPTTLPGPRVDHLDRGEQTGPFGSYNIDEPLPADDWGQTEGVGNEYAYPSDWDNDLHERQGGGCGGNCGCKPVAESALPSDNETRTEAWDFGIGPGKGNEAKGQGAGGYGLGNPSTGGKGVYGPRAELPDDPGGKMHDTGTSDTTPGIENHLVSRPMMAGAALPGDGTDPVARSDYYTGPKGNDFNGVIRADSALPGQGMPAKDAPVRNRPFTHNEHMFGAGELPGDESTTTDWDRDLPNAGYTYERGDQSYVKWDDTTPNMRFDPMHQRGPVEGPYEKQ